MSLSLNTYGGAVSVTFLLSQFITYAAAVADPQETYVQQNGSLDGYVEDYSSSEISETTTAEVGETSSMAAEAVTVTGTDAELAANTLETGVSSTEAKSPTTTGWWTPESAVASATVGTDTTTETASHSENEISISTTEWWTPESLVASATAGADATTEAASLSENEISTPTAATNQFLTAESQAAVPTPTNTATYSNWTPTSITTTSTTGTASGTCGTEWQQCGGNGFTGVDCCLDGLTCVTVNSYWAKCVSASTLALSSTSEGGSPASGDSQSTSKFQTTSVSTIYGESVYSTQITVHTVNSAGSTVDSIVNSKYISSYEKGVSSIATYANSTNGANLGYTFPLGETKENGWKIKAMVAGIVGLSVVLGGL